MFMEMDELGPGDTLDYTYPRARYDEIGIMASYIKYGKLLDLKQEGPSGNINYFVFEWDEYYNEPKLRFVSR